MSAPISDALLADLCRHNGSYPNSYSARSTGPLIARLDAAEGERDRLREALAMFGADASDNLQDLADEFMDEYRVTMYEVDADVMVQWFRKVIALHARTPAGGPIFHHHTECACGCHDAATGMVEAAYHEAVDRLAAMDAVASAATDLLDWIVQMPSYGAVAAGCNTEANQVHATPDQPWRVKGRSTQEHWLDHVGPAIQAAFDAERAMTEIPAHPRWKLRSALMAVWTDGRHTYNPNTGKCVCGKDWLCDMDDDALEKETP